MLYPIELQGQIVFLLPKDSIPALSRQAGVAPRGALDATHGETADMRLSPSMFALFYRPFTALPIPPLVDAGNCLTYSGIKPFPSLPQPCRRRSSSACRISRKAAIRRKSALSPPPSRPCPASSCSTLTPGPDTNRTVVTFVGSPQAVAEAAFQAIAKAAQVIDMSKHRGAHPRLGATDVCPLVPIEGVTLADCAAIARSLGRRVGDELGIPVYFYEAAATTPERVNLADIRRGEYEGLAEKLNDPAWKPDCGPARLHPTAGATVLGAREFLIAYNITLNTPDKAAASDIALELREKGRAARRKTASPFILKGQIIYYQHENFPCGNCDFVAATFADDRAPLPPGPRLRTPPPAGRAHGRPVLAGGPESPPGRQVQVLQGHRLVRPTIPAGTDFHQPDQLPRHAAARGSGGSPATGRRARAGRHGQRNRRPGALCGPGRGGKILLSRQGRSPDAPPADILETAVFSLGLNDVRPFDLRAR